MLSGQIRAEKDFPGDPVAKTSFPMKGAQVWTLVGALDPICCNKKIPHAATKIKDPACHNWDPEQPHKILKKKKKKD